MGAQGAQGTQGTQGAQGIQGTQGTQGLQGITGAQGISGASILGTANTWTNTNAFTTISASGAINASSSGVQALDGVAWAESGFTQNRGSYRAQSSTQNPGLHVVSTSGLPSQGVFSASTARGTLSALTATQVFDGLVLNMRSYGGSTWVNAARIELFGSDTHTETSRPTFITFLTTAVNSVSNAERMRIDASGNVGIGTSSPLAKLNVIGDIKIGDGSNSRGLNLLQNYMSLGETESGATTILGNNIKATDGVNSTVQVSTSANDGSVWVALNFSNGITFNRIAAAAIGTQYSENAGELMRITTAGNVGIGTTSPTSPLNVRGSIGYGAIRLSPTSDNGESAIAFYTNAAATDTTNAWVIGQNVWGIGTTKLGFGIQTFGGPILTIQSNGKVGIGTTAPAQNLSLGDGYNLSFQNNLGATGTYGAIYSYNRVVNLTTPATAIRFLRDVASIGPDGAIAFDTNNTERARIDSSGTLSLNAAFITGGYFNSQQYTLGSIATSGTQWVKICGVASPCQFQVKGFFGTNASEEQFEIDVKTTYYAAQAVINCRRQSYSAALAEVRVEGSSGGEHILYVKFNSNGFAGTITWRVIDSSATPYIYNTITTPVGALYSSITVSGGKVYSTNEDITTAGALSKGSGSFRIEHPLPSKSETHELVHSFIEGPQADLIYRGKATLVNGVASVNIDTSATMTEGTFEALCREVQCFTTNESGWTAIRGKVTGNILTIQAQDSTCTDEISWMVIGERKDKHMMDTEWTDENGKVIVEPLKPIKETAETRDV
jgi:hypothetical protein